MSSGACRKLSEIHESGRKRRPNSGRPGGGGENPDQKHML